ncbi:MAG: response regulator [Armatimonadetes bacterium]|nr:response regulator [Armatimonadota bacterium]
MKILVIEDTLLAREKAGRALRELGHEVILAYDGDDGLRKFKDENPDAVITDINMPYMDGVEAIRLMRKVNANAQIFVCSGSADRDQIKQALQAGASDILPKPLSMEQVKVVLSQVERRKPKFLI